MGCTDTPTTCNELFAFVSEHGWPKDAEADDVDSTECKVDPMSAEPFFESSSFELWGSGRAARNVCRSDMASPSQFDCAEAGPNNYLEHIGKQESETREALLMISGKPLAGDATCLRYVFFVGGWTWSPKVLYLQQLHGRGRLLQGGPRHALPCCRQVSAISYCWHLPVDRLGTSAELVLQLTKTLSCMELSRLSYDIDTDNDQSLKWSLVNTFTIVGALWRAGMKQPLLGAEVAERREAQRAAAALSKLRSSDPLSQPSRLRPSA